MNLFDLNIEQILENWETHHAIREIIANALDEQILTTTKDVEIFKVGEKWHIRDYGRGLKYAYFTQNESQEKLLNQNVIGKFGVGLKDALATFDRKGIQVLIKSSFGDITTLKTAKQGFPDILTLHAKILDASEPGRTGTEFIFEGVWDDDIEAAKKLFLRFSNEEILENTKTGQVIRNTKEAGKIYINGVLVAKEPTFLFSYNITKKTKKIQNSLNRERTNVGRTAYSDSVKSILLETRSVEVSEELANDFQQVSVGTAHDEIKSWKDVQIHAIKILNQSEKKYVFVTQNQMLESPNLMDEAISSGHKVIQVTESVSSTIENLKDLSGNAIKGMTQFLSEYNDSFEFEFVDIGALSEMERQTYGYTSEIVRLYGGLPEQVKNIKIASRLRKDLLSSSETLGCWDGSTDSVVIKRTQLKSLPDYAGTLVHELIHAKTDTSDVTREFESELTSTIGKLCAVVILAKGKLSDS